MAHGESQVTGQPAVAWHEQSGYPDRIVPGSPEHNGAHAHLHELVVHLESDFEPYGKSTREGEQWRDCSCDCRHFAVLKGPLASDWGVCMNARSTRAGLLTFEHQGCPAFESGPELDPFDAEE